MCIRCAQIICYECYWYVFEEVQSAAPGSLIRILIVHSKRAKGFVADFHTALYIDDIYNTDIQEHQPNMLFEQTLCEQNKKLTAFQKEQIIHFEKKIAAFIHLEMSLAL